MDLHGLFGALRLKRDSNLLVGIETNDDAAIYKINDDVAAVLTADYITPFIDDPYVYGQVAAANSLSDVYAMGGRPIAVLNLCMFPLAAGKETLEKVLQGGLDKTHEAGAFLVGGHTVKDEEMKYGLSVLGFVHPKKYTPNSGARPGDKFILTKPVGSGVHITGARRGLIPREELLPVALKMAELNKTACEVMAEFEAGGATDITGFGLGGHTLSMARASRIGIRFFYEAVPRFPRTVELIDKGVMTGLTMPNRKLLEGGIEFTDGLEEAERAIFWDPQTSGGLFFGVPAKDADACLKRLHEKGVADARVVAEAFSTDKPRLEVSR